MYVIIVGAGTVGTSIAENLCKSDLNVVLMDSSPEALSRAEERLDVQTLLGNGCDATALFRAGIAGSDLFLAVTSSDESNLAGASIAKAMGSKRCVARVYDPAYRDYSTFDYQSHFKIDRLLSLEHLTALELAKELKAPGMYAVENFARGGVEVQEVAVDGNSKLVGKQVHEIGLPRGVLLGLIVRDEKPGFIPTRDDEIRAEDHITLVGQREKLEEVRKRFEKKTRHKKFVVIAGGGDVGYHLAVALQRSRFKVTILETDLDRCEFLAAKLGNCTVLHADSTRRVELEEARVKSCDAFIACTGDDEDNLVCAVEAKELGADRTLCVVRRPDYANVLQRLGIDAAVSPRNVMAREVTGLLMTSPVIGRSEVGDGDAVAVEVEILEGAAVAGKTLRELRLPRSLVAAIVEEEYVRTPGPEDVLKPGSTAVLLVGADNLEAMLDSFRV